MACILFKCADVRAHIAIDDFQRNVVHGFAHQNKVKETRLQLTIVVHLDDFFCFFLGGLALFIEKWPLNLRKPPPTKSTIKSQTTPPHHELLKA